MADTTQSDLDLLSGFVQHLEDAAANGTALKVGEPGTLALVLRAVLTKAYPEAST